MTLQVPRFEKSGSKSSNQAAKVEDLLGCVVDVKRFVENFEMLAQAAGGTACLKSLVTGLALRGRLTSGSDETRVVARHATPSASDASSLPTLPPHWAWATLDSLLSFGPKNGYSPKAVEFPTKVKSLTLTATTSGRFDGRFFKYIDEEIPAESEFWLRDGDLLVQRGNTIEYVGVAAVYRGPPHTFIYPDLMMKLRTSDDVNVSFVHMAINGPVARAFLMGRASGTSGSMPKINQATLLAVPIPLPPLPEQKRIVVRVDELMKLIDDLEAKQAKKREVQVRFRTSALDAVITAEGQVDFERAWSVVTAHLPTIVREPEDVAALRSAIHGIACGGRLSATVRSPAWGKGDELVSSLLDARRPRRRELVRRGARSGSLPPETRATVDPTDIPAVPESWTVCGMDDILACRPNAMKAGPFGSALTKSMYVTHGYKVYGQEQVIPGDATVGHYYVDAEKYDSLKSCAVAPGDMLISMMGTVGKVLILPEGCEAGIINPRLLKLSLDEQIFAPYIKLYFASPQARQVIQRAARGVAMDGLNIAILRTLPIPLPPRPEQVWLVAKVEQLMKLCDDLEAQLKAKEGTASKLVEAVVKELVA